MTLAEYQQLVDEYNNNLKYFIVNDEYQTDSFAVIVSNGLDVHKFIPINVCQIFIGLQLKNLWKKYCFHNNIFLGKNIFMEKLILPHPYVRSPTDLKIS